MDNQECTVQRKQNGQSRMHSPEKTECGQSRMHSPEKTEWAIKNAQSRENIGQRQTMQKSQCRKDDQHGISSHS